MRAEACFDFAEDELFAEGQPDSIEATGGFRLFALSRIASFGVERADDRWLLGNVVFDATAHAFEERGDVEEIMRLGLADFVG